MRSLLPGTLYNTIQTAKLINTRSINNNNNITLISKINILSINKQQFSSQSSNHRIFSNYVIHKGKSALDFSVVPAQIDLSTNQNYYRVTRPGSYMISVAPAKSEKQYDWSNKIIFQLNIDEAGELIDYHNHNNNKDTLTFYHDPQANTPQAGQAVKSISIRRTVQQHNNSITYFVNISYNKQSDNIEQKYSIPITHSEMTILTTIMKQTLTQLLSLDTTPVVQQKQ